MLPISRRQFLTTLAGLIGVGSTATWASYGGGPIDDFTVAGGALPVSTTAPTGFPTTTIASRPTTSTLPPTTSTLATGAGAIQAICKAAWGGREPFGTLTSHTIERMTVHHTGLTYAGLSAPARVRAVQGLHVDDRGWVDLAYHFVVDADGNVYEGRPVTAVGDTATNYDPTGHFLVCAEGDFNSQVIPAAQVSAVADVLAWGAVNFGVDPSTIRGHRDWAATSCPGETFYRLISGGILEQAVRDRVAGGAPGLSILCGEAAAQRVADIEAGLA